MIAHTPIRRNTLRTSTSTNYDVVEAFAAYVDVIHEPTVFPILNKGEFIANAVISSNNDNANNNVRHIHTNSNTLARMPTRRSSSVTSSDNDQEDIRGENTITTHRVYNNIQTLIDHLNTQVHNIQNTTNAITSLFSVMSALAHLDEAERNTTNNAFAAYATSSSK